VVNGYQGKVMVMGRLMRTSGRRLLLIRPPVWEMVMKVSYFRVLVYFPYHSVIAADGAIPFNTQFFHDDYDDGPGFDDNDIDDPSTGAGISAEQEEQDLLAAISGNTSRRVRPQFVNYAKKAKRVDVRKLKDNIWKGLNIVTPEKNKDSMVCVPILACIDFISDGRLRTRMNSNLRRLQQILLKHACLTLSYRICDGLIRGRRWMISARVSVLFACYI
jgi:Condensin complex subunit 2